MKKRKKMAVVVLIILGIIIDQITKWLASTGSLSGTLIPRLFSSEYHRNTGAAYSILSGQTVYLIIITTLAIGLLVYLFVHAKSNMMRVGLAFMLSGAVGNFIDRVLHGFVIDFIKTEFMQFPIFNVADILICTGAVITGYVFVFMEK